tara:strand:- start:179 stop:433 length:255 start_codon:yes stop_codon:yes gene_type:complete
MTAKKKRGRPRKLTSEQLEMARRYESVWHYMYAQLPDHIQKRINTDPLGLSASEFAKRVARKAESNAKIESDDTEDNEIIEDED